MFLHERKSGLLVPQREGSPDYYRDSKGEIYVAPKRCGYASMPVLEFLKGQPWDEFALCWVHALRPSKIRVTAGAETTDSSPYRVTVRIDSQNRIKEIHQEVEVGLRDVDRYGADLTWEMEKRHRAAEENRG